MRPHAAHLRPYPQRQARSQCAHLCAGKHAVRQAGGRAGGAGLPHARDAKAARPCVRALQRRDRRAVRAHPEGGGEGPTPLLIMDICAACPILTYPNAVADA